VYLLVFIQNLIMHLAEKTLFMQPLTFGGDLPCEVADGQKGGETGAQMGVAVAVEALDAHARRTAAFAGFLG